jgi:hypothetical protein
VVFANHDSEFKRIRDDNFTKSEKVCIVAGQRAPMLQSKGRDQGVGSHGA